MFALSNRSFRNAGFAFYGLGGLASLGMISDQASAQTLANNSQASAGITRSNTCDDHFKDPSPKGIERYVECEILEIRRRTAEHERSSDTKRTELAKLKSENACQDILIKGIEKGRILPDKVRAVYGNRPIGSVPACTVLDQLTKG